MKKYTTTSDRCDDPEFLPRVVVPDGNSDEWEMVGCAIDESRRRVLWFWCRHYPDQEGTTASRRDGVPGKR